MTVAAVAVALTGAAVATGVAVDRNADLSTNTGAALMADVSSAAGQPSSEVIDRLEAERTRSVSRSDRRSSVDRTKLDRLRNEAQSGGQVTRTEKIGGGDPKAIAQALLPEFGFSSDQFSCLDSLWTRESGWSSTAANPSSSAYGIPQALPGSKMASAGADWATNPATQIRWGLGYIADRYGSPCGAWSHSESVGWY